MVTMYTQPPDQSGLAGLGTALGGGLGEGIGYGIAQGLERERYQRKATFLRDALDKYTQDVKNAGTKEAAMGLNLLNYMDPQFFDEEFDVQDVVAARKMSDTVVESIYQEQQPYFSDISDPTDFSLAASPTESYPYSLDQITDLARTRATERTAAASEKRADAAMISAQNADTGRTYLERRMNELTAEGVPQHAARALATEESSGQFRKEFYETSQSIATGNNVFLDAGQLYPNATLSDVSQAQSQGYASYQNSLREGMSPEGAEQQAYATFENVLKQKEERVRLRQEQEAQAAEQEASRERQAQQAATAEASQDVTQQTTSARRARVGVQPQQTQQPAQGQPAQGQQTQQPGAAQPRRAPVSGAGGAQTTDMRAFPLPSGEQVPLPANYFDSKGNPQIQNVQQRDQWLEALSPYLGREGAWNYLKSLASSSKPTTSSDSDTGGNQTGQPASGGGGGGGTQSRTFSTSTGPIDVPAKLLDENGKPRIKTAADIAQWIKFLKPIAQERGYNYQELLNEMKQQR